MTGDEARDRRLGLRVLLVDDDQFIQTIVQIALSELGVRQITRALNGEQALMQLDGYQDAFDLVICDLSMPGIKGPELLDHLATRGFSGAVLIMSGEATAALEAAEQRGRQLGLRMIGALGKPVSQKRLVELLGRL